MDAIVATETLKERRCVVQKQIWELERRRRLIHDVLLQLECPIDERPFWYVTPSGLRLLTTEPDAKSLINTEIKTITSALEGARNRAEELSEQIEMYGVTSEDVIEQIKQQGPQSDEEFSD